MILNFEPIALRKEIFEPLKNAACLSTKCEFSVLGDEITF
jgi:hypothetical protein